MFFHPLRKVEKTKKCDSKDIKKYHDSCGLTPVIAPVLDKDFMRNFFGWIRNDIQQYMAASDDAVRESILRNLEQVRSSKNKDATLQDVFDSIIPSNVQTPAEIQRFGRVLASKFEGRFDSNTLVAELVEKVPAVPEKVVENQPEL